MDISLSDPSAAAIAAYEDLAPHYDAFTSHPDYATWVRRLERLARVHGLRGRRALDVGCGTGKSLVPLLTLGYEVTGCDPVPAMLARAAAKTGGAARLVEAEITRLPVVGEFDYVTCLNDVCNYVLGPDELCTAFQGLAANLAPAGVLLFDVSTVAAFRGFWSSVEWREHAEGIVVWRGGAPRPFAEGDLARGEFEIFAPDGETWRRRTVRHVQRAHSAQEVVAAMREAGLRLLAVYGQHDHGPPEPRLDPNRHIKAVYVATRQQ